MPATDKGGDKESSFLNSSFCSFPPPWEGERRGEFLARRCSQLSSSLVLFLNAERSNSSKEGKGRKASLVQERERETERGGEGDDETELFVAPPSFLPRQKIDAREKPAGMEREQLFFLGQIDTFPS